MCRRICGVIRWSRQSSMGCLPAESRLDLIAHRAPPALFVRFAPSVPSGSDNSSCAGKPKQAPWRNACPSHGTTRRGQCTDPVLPVGPLDDMKALNGALLPAAFSPRAMRILGGERFCRAATWRSTAGAGRGVRPATAARLADAVVLQGEQQRARGDKAPAARPRGDAIQRGCQAVAATKPAVVTMPA
jgi:hypothetical protein